MNLLDLCFPKETMDLLRSFPCKLFDAYKADPTLFPPTRLFPCGLCIDGAWYVYGQRDETRQTSDEEVLPVTIFERADEKEIKSQREDVTQETVPVKKKIISVKVVNEKKKVKTAKGIIYDIWLTREVTFTFEEGRLTFRKPVYFSPFYNIETGSAETKALEEADRLPEEWEELFDTDTEEETIVFD